MNFKSTNPAPRRAQLPYPRFCADEFQTPHVPQEPASDFLTALFIPLQLIFHFVAEKNTKQKQNGVLNLLPIVFPLT